MSHDAPLCTKLVYLWSKVPRTTASPDLEDFEMIPPNRAERRRQEKNGTAKPCRLPAKHQGRCLPVKP